MINVNDLLSNVFRSWKTKLFTIFLVVILFFVYTSGHIDTEYFYLPVTVIAPEGMDVIFDEPPTVLVSASQSSLQFKEFNYKFIELEVDLSHANKPGVYREPIVLKHEVYLQHFESFVFSPEYLTITLIAKGDLP